MSRKEESGPRGRREPAPWGGFFLPFLVVQPVHLEKTMNKFQQQLLAVAGLVTGAIGSAHAALPVEATAAFTTISGNVTDVLAAMWPIVALATGGFVLVKLFKKGANKAV